MMESDILPVIGMGTMDGASTIIIGIMIAIVISITTGTIITTETTAIIMTEMTAIIATTDRLTVRVFV